MESQNTEADASTDEKSHLEHLKLGVRFPSCRHVLTFMSFLGFFNVYALRVNLSVALVAMVNQTQAANSSVSDECPAPSNQTNTVQGHYDWDPNLQGLILGSFFYGYIITQIPGGWLSERFGAKLIYGLGVLCTSVFTLVTPLAAHMSPYVLIATRVLEGIESGSLYRNGCCHFFSRPCAVHKNFIHGVTFPSMHALLAKWAPPEERSKLGAFIYAGAYMGTVVSLPISGYLCQSDFLGGWPSVFYLFGTVGCLWFVGWMFLVYNSPAVHPRISFAEKQYIEKSIGHKELKPPTPWKAILTSVHFWAILVTHTCNNWGFYTLLTTMPMYMKKVLRFNISSNGLVSAIPYLCQWIVANVAGQTADALRRKNIMSTTTVRKTFNTLGSFLPALFIVITGYVGCNKVLAVLFLSLGVGSGGIAMAGYNINHLDLAPPFAGTMLGLTNAAATIPGFVGPQVVGILTNDDPSRHQWQIAFYIASAIYVFGGVFYAVFASGEEQPWASGTQRDFLVQEDNEDDPLDPPPGRQRYRSLNSRDSPVQ